MKGSETKHSHTFFFVPLYSFIPNLTTISQRFSPKLLYKLSETEEEPRASSLNVTSPRSGNNETYILQTFICIYVGYKYEQRFW